MVEKADIVDAQDAVAVLASERGEFIKLHEKTETASTITVNA